MVRDIDKHKQSEEVHRKWQFDYFTVIKNKLIEKGKEWIKKDEIKKGELILKEADAMKFVYQNTSYINYGRCSKLQKDVSFIPNTCQLETQGCFVHRKDTHVTI